MILDLRQEKWQILFGYLNRQHFQWETRIEIINEYTGKQLLSEGLPLSGITTDVQGSENILKINVGAEVARQAYVVENPQAIKFFYFQNEPCGILEVDEGNGTATLLHFYPRKLSPAEHNAEKLRLSEILSNAYVPELSAAQI